MKRATILFLLLFLLIIGCSAQAETGEATPPELPIIPEETIRLQLPEDWISLALGDAAAEMGVMFSVRSPDSGISLQVLHLQDTTLSDTKALLTQLHHVTDIQDYPEEEFASISYQLDDTLCYIIQVGDQEAIGLNFTLSTSDQREQAALIAKDIIASIEIIEPMV